MCENQQQLEPNPNYDSRHHLVVNDFYRLRYLNVTRRIDYLSVNLMHSVYFGRAPSYLCDFTRTSDIHSHVTRYNLMAFIIPHVKTQGKLTFKYNGAKLWNSIPVNIKKLENKDSFKCAVKLHLSNMFETENCDYVYY